jgi:putative lipase involved disintegration of autophagic bodies
LCKIEINYLLIYKERPELDEECQQEESQENDAFYNQVVDKIKVSKPIINEQISDWV